MRESRTVLLWGDKIAWRAFIGQVNWHELENSGRAKFSGGSYSSEISERCRVVLQK